MMRESMWICESYKSRSWAEVTIRMIAPSEVHASEDAEQANQRELSPE